MEMNDVPKQDRVTPYHRRCCDSGSGGHSRRCKVCVIFLIAAIIVIVIAVPCALLLKSPVNVPAVTAAYEYSLYVQGYMSQGQFSAASTSTNFNSDGYDDLLLGAPGMDATYLIFGRQVSFNKNTATMNVASISGVVEFVGATGDQTGAGVATGDVNHDGYQDAIFSATNAGPNGVGVVYVVYGNANLQGGQIQITQLLTTPNASFGYAILGPNPSALTGVNVYAADLNADGYDDIVIGCANATVDGGNTYPGATYIVWSGPNMPALVNLAQRNAIYVTTFVGAHDQDQFGNAVATPGDMNGDGVLDFVASSPNYNSMTGAVYIIYGSKTKYPQSTISVRSLGASMGRTILGRTNDLFGYDLSFVGDFNNDGLADVAVGSPGAVSSIPGSAMVIFGSKAIVNGAMSITQVKGTIFTGANAGNQFGDAVGPAGDFNLDGISDLTVGAPGAGSKGDVYVLYGQSGHYPATLNVNKLNSHEGTVIPAPMASTGIGAETWGGFDFNGDGRAEVAAPLPNESINGQSGAGALYILFDLSP